MVLLTNSEVSNDSTTSFLLTIIVDPSSIKILLNLFLGTTSPFEKIIIISFLSPFFVIPPAKSIYSFNDLLLSNSIKLGLYTSPETLIVLVFSFTIILSPGDSGSVRFFQATLNESRYTSIPLLNALLVNPPALMIIDSRDSLSVIKG